MWCGIYQQQLALFMDIIATLIEWEKQATAATAILQYNSVQLRVELLEIRFGNCDGLYTNALQLCLKVKD